MSKPSSGRFVKNNLVAKALIKEVKDKYGENKITEEDVIGIMKLGDGRIIWLERGKSGEKGSGLLHILESHTKDFNNIGINSENIAAFVLNAAANGKIIAQQNKDGTRPIFEYMYGGKAYYVAVTIGSNGYIVGANPISINKLRRHIK